MDSPLTTTLLAVGALTAFSVVYRVLSFIVLYARPSKLSRYLHTTDGRPAWALVTGASDGIGKALARELATRGFNVVLHGRNPAKLGGVEAELAAAFPARSFQTLVIDAGNVATPQGVDFGAVAAALSGLNLTVLINNAGGGPVSPIFETLERFPESTILTNISVNALFPTLLLARLLPQLARGAPALVINIGSLSDNGLPFLSFYGSSKSFMMTCSTILAREAVVEGRDVEVIGIRVGEVTAGAVHKDGEATVFRPSTRTMARATLARVGCGRPVVVGYLGHAVQNAFVELLPGPLLEWLYGKLMTDMREEDRRRLKKSP